MKWDIDHPQIAHVEVTEACNEKCEHCYNFDRLESYKPKTLILDEIDVIIGQLLVNKVSHVIITGGEPLLALEQTCYLAQRAIESGMTISLNSNLLSATPENMKALQDAGVEHILTTLFSYKPETHNAIANTKGAHTKITLGIVMAQKMGIRVTVNMIVTEKNKDDIYKTGLYVKNLGGRKFLANRIIPCKTGDFLVTPEIAQKMFDDLLAVKQDFDMFVGTCRMVPECFFDDLEKYKDFINRGCSAGKKHVVITVSGDVHACPHDWVSYGNIYTDSLAHIWKNMQAWRSDLILPEECQSCSRIETCKGGCRIVGIHCEEKMWGRDNLCRK